MSEQKTKVPVIGYIALICAIIFFSGILPNIATNINKGAIAKYEERLNAGEIAADLVKDEETKAKRAGLWLNAFDFGKLQGAFGTISGAKGNFTGSGGSGARAGFLFALTLIPSVMFALGFIEVVSNYGGLRAAQRLLTPLLRPLLGIPGITGLALISSLQSTDAGASMTKALKESGDITEKEKTVFSMFQFSAGATITNFLSSGAAMIDLVIPVMPSIVLVSFILMFSLKIFGANLMRFFIIKMLGGENE